MNNLMITMIPAELLHGAVWVARRLGKSLRCEGEVANNDSPIAGGGFPLFRLHTSRWADWRFRWRAWRFRMDRTPTPTPINGKELKRLRRKVQKIEASILKITGTEFFILSHLSEKECKRVGALIGERKWLLDRMFVGTPEEVERMRAVNGLLLDLTRRMYSRSAALYRSLLTVTCDADMDDNVWVEGMLTYECDGKSSLLSLPEDAWYGSDFYRMMQVIDALYVRHAEGFVADAIESTVCKSLSPHDRPEMSDAELDFENTLDDGTTWAEGPLCHPSLSGICICHAVHDICTHKSYSIPDLLRMNDFRCEVTVVHQRIADQSGWRRREQAAFNRFRD